MSRSAERARGWGVPVPGSNDVIYVWFDALANYLRGLDYGSDETLFWRNWAQQGEPSHFVGKGISKFHAIYWPAILLSAGVLLPSSIFVHGYLTVDGERSENRRATASVRMASPWSLFVCSRFCLNQPPGCTRNSEYRARRGMTFHSPLAEWGHLLERFSSRGRQWCERGHDSARALPITPTRHPKTETAMQYFAAGVSLFSRQSGLTPSIYGAGLPDFSRPPWSALLLAITTDQLCFAGLLSIPEPLTGFRALA